MKRKIIVLAAHDDGSGAHVVMTHVCRALLEVGRKAGENPLLLYHNSSNVGSKWAEPLMFDTSRGRRWKKWKAPGTWPKPAELRRLDGIWFPTDNVLRFGKRSDGSLDVPATRSMLNGVERRFPAWGAFMPDAIHDQVVLAIEMGVPQLAKWAHDRDVPTVSVGDMFWSRTLRHSLEGAGEYDRDVEAALNVIAGYERLTEEVWLLPLVAPREYVDYFGELGIPLLMLPGLIGPRPGERDVRASRDVLKIKSEKLVVLGAGTTRVWSKLYREMDDLVKKRGADDFALLHPIEGGMLRLTDGKRQRDFKQTGGMLPYFLAADLGVTRGGITMTEFVSCRLPFVVVQEPDHWLSRKQQAQMREAGLCHSTCLSRLRKPRQAVDLSRRCLASSENAGMVARMGTYPYSVEYNWAKYLIENRLKAFD